MLLPLPGNGPGAASEAASRSPPVPRCRLQPSQFCLWRPPCLPTSAPHRLLSPVVTNTLLLLLLLMLLMLLLCMYTY